MTDLNRLTLSEARDRLRAKETTSVELTEACLTAIDGVERIYDAPFFHEVALRLDRPVAGVIDALAARGALFSRFHTGSFPTGPMRQDLLAGRWDYLPVGLLCSTHYRFFTRRTIEDTLRAAGLTDFEIMPQRTEPPPWLDRLPGNLEIDASSLSTHGFYVVIRIP